MKKVIAMRTHRPIRTVRLAASILSLGAGLALAGCGGIPQNRSMYSEHQPVVETMNYSLDLAAGSGGLAYGEQQRLAGWLEAMKLKYGDKIYVDDPAGNAATRDAVGAVASRQGILISEQAPITEGAIQPGTVRVVLTRTRASVPSCPNWSSNSDFNPSNGLSSNYGCATNSNIAAMVANPEDLLHGAETTGDTVLMTSTKAIEAYRKATTTGKGNTVSETSTTNGGN